MSRDPVTGLSGAYKPTEPEKSALVKPVTVRTIRPHDTTEGMKQPGDEYPRSLSEAEPLETAGVVSIIRKRGK
ncbi:hypothetical protein ACH0BU_04190 [Sphingomonas olei]